MTEPRNNAGKTRGRPFPPGNPGKPKGARHKATLAIDALLDGEADAITRKAIEMAKAGDTVALRLCLDRIAPVRKGRPVAFDLPADVDAAGIAAVFAAVLRGVAEGEITPEEGAAVGGLLEARRKAIETVEIEAWIAALEERNGR